MTKTGLQLIQHEMSMQHADALASLKRNQPVIEQMVNSLEKNNKRIAG
jgi:hypothetical protein